MAGKAAVHCHHRLFVRGDDLTTAMRAFIEDPMQTIRTVRHIDRDLVISLPCEIIKREGFFEQSIELFNHLATEISRRVAEGVAVTIDDTICRRVAGREALLAEFSSSVDVVLFVAGRKSSNGRVLCDVCRRANGRTYHIEEASEIDPAWLVGAESVGICGATSTPRWLMEEVAEALQTMSSE